MVIFDFKLCSFKNLYNPITFKSNAKKQQKKRKLRLYDFCDFGTKKTVTQNMCYCDLR